MKCLDGVGRLILLAFVLCLPLCECAFAYWQQDGNPICTAEGDQSYAEITSDGAGGAIIAWGDNRGGHDIYAQRVDASGSVLWAVDGVAICATTDVQEYPQITSDGAGGAIITWLDCRNAIPSDIYAQRVDASGNVLWTTDGVAICTAGDGQVDQQITSDGAGGAIITWLDYRNSSDYEDVYAQRVDASGNVLWTTDGVAICTTPESQWDAVIITDGAGGAIIAWTDYRNPSGIYAQRMDTSGTALWQLGGVAVGTTTHGYTPQITSDGAGGAIITWEGLGGEGDIYARRVDASGSKWGASIGICTETGRQCAPRIASDGAGGAIITWTDERTSSDYSDLYAQRVGASGTVLWTTNGVAVCTAADSQGPQEITSDGVGGGVITWQDFRSNGHFDIYAQRVDASGAMLWAEDGVVICSAQLDQGYPQIASDGAGGAIITWGDYRSNSNHDIYAQRAVADNGSCAVDETIGYFPVPVLNQNVPNPFNPSTSISFTLPKRTTTKLSIYNIEGKLVTTLVDDTLDAGFKEVTWDGEDFRGNPVSSGVYFLSLPKIPSDRQSIFHPRDITQSSSIEKRY